MTGYTGVGGNYAIKDLNLTVAAGGAGIGVSARNNNFGPYVDQTVIENCIFDNDDDATRTNIDTSNAQGQVTAASSVVYVDDNWVGKALGTVIDLDGNPLTTSDDVTMGVDAFAHIQDGVNAVLATGTVNVEAGTYEIGRASVGKECRSRWSPYH